MKIKELFEDSVKHVTFCFGRMNPPTLGHAQVFKTMQQQGGDYQIFLSKSQDKKTNPLPYDEKIKFVKAMFPAHAGKIVENPDLKTPVQVASYLYDQGYNSMTFVGGDDRKNLFEMIKQYNGVEGKAHGFYNFEFMDFVSSGEREEGGEGISGISASAARQAAIDGDLKKFAETTGAGELAEDLYKAVRQGLGIKTKDEK